MKLPTVVLLVLLLVVLSLPILVSGAVMDPCPACPDGLAGSGWGMCFILAATTALFVASVRHGVRVAPHAIELFLLARSLDRPPRQI
ncbi:MAG TPA: hypothetical protein VHL78_14125 [Actinomycetota bacterium]|nr:hypothetical protein [Actinomycetota bacterium]